MAIDNEKEFNMLREAAKIFDLDYHETLYRFDFNSIKGILSRSSHKNGARFDDRICFEYLPGKGLTFDYKANYEPSVANGYYDEIIPGSVLKSELNLLKERLLS